MVTPVEPIKREVPILPENKETQAFDSGTKQQLKPVGSSGTEVIGGFFSEEYLAKLRGTRGAKVWDEMRRSEAQVAMLLGAVTNPIKSAEWEMEPFSQDAKHVRHAELINFILKDGIDWETFLHEALTLIPFGYSLFEVVHNVVFAHPKFGTFNGLAQLGFRSQKTIERWDLEKQTGKIKCVNQFVVSDVGETNVNIPGDFLLCFSNLKEGDNYEGISALRPMYGPWSRKNLYLKLIAIGVEKYAVGVPKGTIPAGKEKSEEVAEFKRLLGSFVSHEAAYMLTPEGWNLEVMKHEFDADKIKSLVILENTEMVNALIANFLALGMNSAGGARALGTDLADFFMGGIQAYANVVAGGMNRNLIPNLVKLNFGQQDGYPKIKCVGINDNAGKELADVLGILIDKGAIEPDLALEAFLRKGYKLPKKDPLTTRKAAKAEVAGAVAPVQLSEQRLQLAETYKQSFNAAKDELKSSMQSALSAIYARMRSQVKTAFKQAPESSKVSAVIGLEAPGVPAYRAALKDAFAKYAFESIEAARKEVPASVRNVKLAEPRGGYFDALPPAVKKLVDTQASLVSQTQAADLEKAVYFQFASSATSTPNIDEILNDIDEKVMPVIDGSTATGMSIDVAAGDALAHIVQQSRLEFFFEPEVLEEIESFTFENEDPVSEICQSLDGTTFAVGDPDLDRYSPPLHHNCKSRLVPNLKTVKGNPEVDTGGVSLSKKALDSMTLCEHSAVRLFR